MEKYHIANEIGAGEFSQVFKGREKKKIEFVAIKRVDKSAMQKVVSEVQIMHKLSHPHVLRFFDWYETKNNLWLILEYCSGGTLETIFLQDGHLPETSIRMFCLDIMAGLMYVHSLGFIHNDIQPKNFQIDEYGILKICDFKYTVKLPKQPPPSSNTNQIEYSNPAYIAPELFPSGCVIPSYQSDLWSLGCVIYQIRRGLLPFGNCLITTHYQQQQQQAYGANQHPVSLSKLIENIQSLNPFVQPYLPTSLIAAGAASPSSASNGRRLGSGSAPADYKRHPNHQQGSGSKGYHQEEVYATVQDLPSLSPLLADLLQWLLEKDVSQRCTWEQVCSHPFWQSFQPTLPGVMPAQPALEVYFREQERLREVQLQQSFEAEVERSFFEAQEKSQLLYGNTPLKMPRKDDVNDTPLRPNTGDKQHQQQLPSAGTSAKKRQPQQQLLVEPPAPPPPTLPLAIADENKPPRTPTPSVSAAAGQQQQQRSNSSGSKQQQIIGEENTPRRNIPMPLSLVPASSSSQLTSSTSTACTNLTAATVASAGIVGGASPARAASTASATSANQPSSSSSHLAAAASPSSRQQQLSQQSSQQQQQAQSANNHYHTFEWNTSFPEDIFFHAAIDCQVKPLIGNKTIEETVEDYPAIEKHPAFVMYKLKEIEQLLPPLELENHLSQVYRCLYRNFTSANTANNQTNLSALLQERVLTLQYLAHIAMAAEVSNIVLNAPNFLSILLKTLKLSATTAPVATIATAILQQQARYLVATCLGYMIRFATIIQPPPPSSSSSGSRQAAGSGAANGGSSAGREDHLVNALISVLKDTAAANAVPNTGRNHSSISLQNDPQMIMLLRNVRRRCFGALGEMIFYIAAQEDDTNTSNNNSPAADQQQQQQPQPAKWPLPTSIIDFLTRSLKEETDIMIKHYLVKTIENIFATGTASFGYVKKLVTLELAQTIVEIAQQAAKANQQIQPQQQTQQQQQQVQHLQGTAGMALYHLLAFVLKYHLHPYPATTSAAVNTAGGSTRAGNAPAKKGTTAANLAATTSTTSATAGAANGSSLVDPFAMPYLVNGSKFVVKVLEKMHHPYLLDVLKEGPSGKLQQAYLNILALLFLAPLHAVASGNNEAGAGSAVSWYQRKVQLPLLQQHQQLPSSPSAASASNPAPVTIPVATMQAILAIFAPLKSFYLRSHNLLLPALCRLIEQGSLQAVRAKALLFYQLLLTRSSATAAVSAPANAASAASPATAMLPASNAVATSNLLLEMNIHHTDHHRRLSVMLVRTLEPLLTYLDGQADNNSNGQQQGAVVVSKPLEKQFPTNTYYQMKAASSMIVFLKNALIYYSALLASYIEELHAVDIDVWMEDRLLKEAAASTSATATATAVVASAAKTMTPSKQPVTPSKGSGYSSPTKTVATPGSGNKATAHALQRQNSYSSSSNNSVASTHSGNHSNNNNDNNTANNTTNNRRQLTFTFLQLQQTAEVLRSLTSFIALPTLSRLILPISSTSSAASALAKPEQQQLDKIEDEERGFVHHLARAFVAFPGARAKLASIQQQPKQTAANNNHQESNNNGNAALNHMQEAVTISEQACLACLETIAQLELPNYMPSSTATAGASSRLVVLPYQGYQISLWSAYIQQILSSLLPAASQLLLHPESNTRVSIVNMMRRLVPMYLRFYLVYFTSYSDQQSHGQHVQQAAAEQHLLAVMSYLQPLFYATPSLLLQDEPPIPQYMIRLYYDLMSIQQQQMTSYNEEEESQHGSSTALSLLPQTIMQQMMQVKVTQSAAVTGSSSTGNAADNGGIIGMIVQLLKVYSTSTSANTANQLANNNGNNSSSLLDLPLILLLQSMVDTAIRQLLLQPHRDGYSLLDQLLEANLSEAVAIAIISTVYANISYPFSAMMTMLNNGSNGSSDLDLDKLEEELLLPLIELLYTLLQYVLRAISSHTATAAAADNGEGDSSSSGPRINPQRHIQAEQHRRMISSLRACTPALLLLLAYLEYQSVTLPAAVHSAVYHPSSQQQQQEAIKQQAGQQQQHYQEIPQSYPSQQAHYHHDRLLEMTAKCLGMLFDLFSEAVTSQLFTRQTVLLQENNQEYQQQQQVQYQAPVALTPRMILAGILKNKKLDVKVILKVLKIIQGICRVKMGIGLEHQAKVKELLCQEPLPSGLEGCARLKREHSYATPMMDPSAAMRSSQEEHLLSDIQAINRHAMQLIEWGNKL